MQTLKLLVKFPIPTPRKGTQNAMSTTLRSTSLVDSPKEHHQPDQLEIKRYEDALVKLVQSADTPLTIALQGEWGSGKTSLMNSLRYRLSDDRCEENCFHSVWVNTWEYSLMSGPQEAVVKILMSIITQIGEIHPSQEAAAAKVSRLFRKIGGGIIVGAKLGVNVVAKQTTGVDNLTGVGQGPAHDDEKVEPSSEIRQAKTEIGIIIDECLKKSGASKRGFLFFIDDLDRIDPPVAVQILELLKNVFDIGNCIFILAIDYDVVVKGLKPKFGEYSPATEREFRSFFDKIIQVPFSMPVASYQVDGFLLDSLRRVGFLGDEDVINSTLSDALTFFCRSSVGTNPRSLKRLVNILSLLQLLKEEGETADIIQKQVDFAMVCLQISFPRVYGFVSLEPDVRKWDASFRKRHGLGDLSEEVKARFANDEFFDDEWEQSLFLICQDNPHLHRQMYPISAILNRIASLETEDSPVSERIKASLRIASVTHVSSEVMTEQAVSFQQSPFLKELNQLILAKATPIAEQRGFSDLRQTLGRVQTRLQYQVEVGSGDKICVHTISVYPVEDRFRCQVRFAHWMMFDTGTGWDFNAELAKIGRTRDDFDDLVEKLKNVGSNFNGWLRPEVQVDKNPRFGRSQGCHYFEFNSWYNFNAKSANDFLRDDFITMLTEFLMDLLQLFHELKLLLKEDDASQAALKDQASSGS
jgi:hypothetical protein